MDGSILYFEGVACQNGYKMSMSVPDYANSTNPDEMPY